MQNEVKLGVKQSEAFNLYKSRCNVFMTGPGGTGKSTLIREIYKDGEQNGREIAITALTGQAAQTLGCDAITIHRWAGVGLCKGTTEEIITKTMKNTRACKRWLYTDCLVIDEISMMPKDMFETLDKLGREITKTATKKYRDYRPHRNPDMPFGGLQLVFSGDFFQLPPVEDSTAFCFTSSSWFTTFPKKSHIVLDVLYRQSGDQAEFRKMLNKMREGKLTPKTLQALSKRVVSPPEGVVIPQLYPKKVDVERINNYELEKLDAPLRTYVVIKDESPNISAMITDTIGQYKLGVSIDTEYEKNSYIKKKNEDTSQFVDTENSRIELSNERIKEEYKRKYEENENDEENIKKLKLEEAKLTIPKIRRYVEFSRKDIEEEYKDLEQKIPIPTALNIKQGAHVMCVINLTRLPCNEYRNGYQIYNGCQGKVVSIKDGYPVVAFNGIDDLITMEKHTWSSDRIPGVSFSGIPLILSWAMTIHKSQGSTLDAAIIDLGPGVFAVGQSYVGLSRVKTLEGVYLTAFSDKGVKASPKVREFYEDLDNYAKTGATQPQQHSIKPPPIPNETQSVKEELEDEIFEISPKVESLPEIEPSTKQATKNDIRKFFKIPAN